MCSEPQFWPGLALTITIALTSCPATLGAPTINVAHYNILASYLGNNREPWFLLPLNLTAEERAQLVAKYYEKDTLGAYRHSFADGFGGLLHASQQKEVEAFDKVFQWEARAPKLVDTIRRLDADILSLVEVDHFDYFRDALAETFDGSFAKRPRPDSLDGSSLFWRRERFVVVQEPMSATFADWQPRQGDVLHEDRVMLAVALRDRLDGRVVVAASVHLMRNPEETGKDPMRMLEVSQMMRSLSCFVSAVGADGLVVMGDFNAVPQSWTHLFLLHGWQDCPEAEKGMRDAFDCLEWGPRETACTTKTAARSMWIDYVFYSGQTMELASSPEVEPCPQGPIPDENHPSDHLPVRATVRFLPGVRPLAPQRYEAPEQPLYLPDSCPALRPALSDSSSNLSKFLLMDLAKERVWR